VEGFPLVVWRHLRRDPLPDLAGDPNRERQSRYCQGFEPDWWVPAIAASKWRSCWYPREATQEAVQQWLNWIDTLRVEYLGPFNAPEKASELEADRDSDLALIRETRPDLLPTPATGPIAAYKRERNALDHGWEMRRRANGWDSAGTPSTGECEQQFLESVEQANRQEALIRKHFPRLNLLDIRSADSVPALWAFIALGTEKSALAEYMVGPRVHASKLHAVYKAMHALGVSWAPEPPYASLPEDQAVDKLYSIANRLEREERGGTPADHSAELSMTRTAIYPMADSRATPANTVPAKLLLGWAQILDAVEHRNNETTRLQVRRLNMMHGGPIILGRQGQRPTVDKDKLLTWWNCLEERFQEARQKKQDTESTTQAQYRHGRDAIVAPEIGGHVKKRRKPATGDAG
jgi:hypothetical protein